MQDKTPSSDDSRIEQILESWFAAHHRGDSPSLEELCADTPHLAPRVRRLLDRQASLLGASPGPHPESSKPIDSIGDFELRSRIASGGMGDVYLARQNSLDRMVALKVLRRDLADHPVRRLRFQREARITAALDHPNIVPIFETGEADGHVYLAMKLLDGTTLDQSELPWEPKRVARVGAQIARALHSAHEVGIVHRDIKPGNVLIEGDHPYVLDFGLARGRVDLTLTREGQVPGTLAYMPPEQLRGDAAAIDPRADVYALGATLYQCLTSTPPFPDAKPAVLVRRILASDPDPLRLPMRNRDLETILFRALAKAPARRFPNALAFAEDLECFAEDRPIRSRPPSVMHRIVKLAARHRVATATLVTALIVTLTAVLIVGAELRETARRTAEDRARRIAAAERLLDEGEYTLGLMRIIELREHRPNRAGRQLEDLEWRARSALTRETLLDQLQSDRLYRDIRSLEAIDADLAEAHPTVLADPATAVARTLLAYYADDYSRVQSQLQESAALAEYSRLKAALAAAVQGQSVPAALASLPAESRTSLARRADDHVFTAAILQTVESSPTKAWAEVKSALAADPHHRRARLAQSVLHAAGDEPERAEEALTLFWRKDEPRPEIHIVIARLAIRNRAFDRAHRHLELAETALERLGREPPLRYAVTEIDLALVTGDLDHHAELVDGARRRYGDSSWLTMSAAYAAVKRNDLDKARELFTRGAEESQIAWNTRRAQVALLWLDVQQLISDPTSTDAARRVSELIERGEALRDASRAAGDQVALAEASVHLNTLFTITQDLQSANATLQEALDAEDLNPDATYRYAAEVLNQVWPRKDEATDELGLGDRARRARLLARRLVDRAIADPTLLPASRVFELATCASALAAATGDRDAAIYAGSIAVELSEHAPAGGFDAVLEATRQSLGLDEWPK